MIAVVRLLVELQHEEEVAQLSDLKLWRLLAVDDAGAGGRSRFSLQEKVIEANVGYSSNDIKGHREPVLTKAFIRPLVSAKKSKSDFLSYKK